LGSYTRALLVSKDRRNLYSLYFFWLSLTILRARNKNKKRLPRFFPVVEIALTPPPLLPINRQSLCLPGTQKKEKLRERTGAGGGVKLSAAKKDK
jgi:hypothetical protein